MAVEYKKNEWLRTQIAACDTKGYYFRFFNGVNDKAEERTRSILRKVVPPALITYACITYGLYVPDVIAYLAYLWPIGVCFRLEYEVLRDIWQDMWDKEQNKRERGLERRNDEESPKAKSKIPRYMRKELRLMRPRAPCWKEAQRHEFISSSDDDFDATDEDGNYSWSKNLLRERKELGNVWNPLRPYDCLVNEDEYFESDWLGSSSEFEVGHSHKFMKLVQELVETRWKCRPCLDLATSLVAPAVYLQEIAHAQTKTKTMYMMDILSPALDSVLYILDKISKQFDEFGEETTGLLDDIFWDPFCEPPPKKFQRHKTMNRGVLISRDRCEYNFFTCTQNLRYKIRDAVGEIQDIIDIHTEKCRGLSYRFLMSEAPSRPREELDLWKRYAKGLGLVKDLNTEDFKLHAKNFQKLFIARLGCEPIVKTGSRYVNAAEDFLVESVLKFQQKRTAFEEGEVPGRMATWEEMYWEKNDLAAANIPCKNTMNTVKKSMRELCLTRWEQDMKDEMVFKVAHCGLACRVAASRQYFLQSKLIDEEDLRNYYEDEIYNHVQQEICRNLMETYKWYLEMKNACFPKKNTKEQTSNVNDNEETPLDTSKPISNIDLESILGSAYGIQGDTEEQKCLNFSDPTPMSETESSDDDQLSSGESSLAGDLEANDEIKTARIRPEDMISNLLRLRNEDESETERDARSESPENLDSWEVIDITETSPKC